MKNPTAHLSLAILAGALLLTLATLPFAGAAAWIINSSSTTMNSNLQEISDNNELPLISRITDREGNTIAQIYNQRRVEVETNDISQEMKDSIVAIEDRRFYEHNGVDLRGTLRALAANLSSGSISEGASTLNQQYIKNYLLLVRSESNEEQAAAVETSIPRKLREMKMAGDLDASLSKDEILTRYLNLVSFGNGSFGIEDAARTYFGTTAATLDAAQSAFLAGIVQSTSGLNPYTNPDGALARRNDVLRARVTAGTLPQSEADRLAQTPLGVLDKPNIPPTGCISAGGAGFFCDFVLEWLERHGLDYQQVAEGGYTIRTTLDPRVQKTAEAQSALHVSPDAEGVASATNIIAPRKNSHEVIAMASSRTYGLDAARRQTVLPLTHSLQGHGAGSIFKIFAAAEAIRSGMGLNTILDVPRRVEVQGLGDGGAEGCPPSRYCVENATDNYKPEMTLREALATSPNTPFINIASEVGMERIAKLAVDLGLRSYAKPGSFDDDSSVQDYVTKHSMGSFVLGPTAVDPLELSNVAATLADGGRWCEPLPVLSITDRHGQPVNLQRQDCENVLDRGIADALANGMGSDVASGTAANAARFSGWSGPLSAKTGTTETSFSAAFLGFTPSWAGATYIFNDSGTSANLCTSPVRQCPDGNLYGGLEPARIFFGISQQHIGAYGGPRITDYNRGVYDRGTNPNAFRAFTKGNSADRQPQASTDRSDSSPSQRPNPGGQGQSPDIQIPNIRQGIEDLINSLR